MFVILLLNLIHFVYCDVREEESWIVSELIDAVKEAPTYHVFFEVLLVAVVIKLWFSNSYRIERQELTEQEEDQLISEWQPEPLVPDEVSTRSKLYRTVNGPIKKYISVDGNSCLDLASFNFLGLNCDERIEESAIRSLRKYGVGSCGPRGFYGTIDVHLHLEQRIAEFMRVEEAILYSFGFAAPASCVAPYSKRGDVIFADEAVSFALQQAIVASRSKVRYFKHNDMDDLERLLKKQALDDQKNPKKAKVTRRLILVEGLYLNTGDICPLEKLIELKYAYKVRIFLDESYSIGVLGETGRGITEFLGLDILDIDLIIGSLENSLGSIGGFTCGSAYVVDHQRLSAVGYCYSASLPPLLASSAIESVNIIQSELDMLERLHHNSGVLHRELSKIDKVCVDSCSYSPIQHIRINDITNTREQSERLLNSICDQMLGEGVALTMAQCIEEYETFQRTHSLRLTAKANLTEDEIVKAIAKLRCVVNEILSKR